MNHSREEFVCSRLLELTWNEYHPHYDYACIALCKWIFKVYLTSLFKGQVICADTITIDSSWCIINSRVKGSIYHKEVLNFDLAIHYLAHSQTIAAKAKLVYEHTSLNGQYLSSCIPCCDIFVLGTRLYSFWRWMFFLYEEKNFETVNIQCE